MFAPSTLVNKNFFQKSFLRSFFSKKRPPPRPQAPPNSTTNPTPKQKWAPQRNASHRTVFAPGKYWARHLPIMRAPMFAPSSLDDKNFSQRKVFCGAFFQKSDHPAPQRPPRPQAPPALN